MKRKIDFAAAWQIVGAGAQVRFELDEHRSEENVRVSVRSDKMVLLYGERDEELGGGRVLLYYGHSFECDLRLCGYDALLMICDGECAYQVRTKEGRAVEKIDPTKLELVGPRRDVSDVAAMVEAAIEARLGSRRGFEDPDNALSFDHLTDDELGGRDGYMEPDREIDGDGYMEERATRRDAPPAVGVDVEAHASDTGQGGEAGVGAAGDGGGAARVPRVDEGSERGSERPVGASAGFARSGGPSGR